MASWQEELARQQLEARQRIEELGRQLAEVQSRLEAEEEWLSELEITQRTMRRLLGEQAQIAKPVVGEGAGFTLQVPEQGPEREPGPEVVRRV